MEDNLQYGFYFGRQSAATALVLYGFNDESKATTTYKEMPLPQFTLKTFIVTQKGELYPTLVDATTSDKTFGSKTFDPNEKYFNHQTFFGNAVLSAGNAMMVQRVIDKVNSKKANVVVYCDIKATAVPNYVRYKNGVIKTTADGTKVTDDGTPTVDGYEYKWIAKAEDEDYDPVMREGTLTDSTMYPVFKIPAAQVGEYYNSIGFSLEKPDSKLIDLDPYKELGVIPYRLRLHSKESGSTKIVKSLDGDNGAYATLKDKTKDPYTMKLFSVDRVLDTTWYDGVNRFAEIDDVEIYYSYIEKLTDLFVAKERPLITTDITTFEDGDEAKSTWYDFDDLTDEGIEKKKFLFDILTGRTLSGVFYQSMVKNTDAVHADYEEVEFSSNTPFFLQGGSDGNINSPLLGPDIYNNAVKEYLEEYGDSNSAVMNMADNVESHIFDSGFPFEVKTKFAKVILHRKDIFVVLSTYTHNEFGRTQDIATQRAIGINLVTQLKLSPESVFHNTPTVRAVVCMGSGIPSVSDYSKRVPLTYDLLNKSASSMGSRSGKWGDVVNELQEDVVITTLKKIEPKAITPDAIDTLWNANIIHPVKYDHTRYTFSSLQTVMSSSDSTLNNYVTVSGGQYLNKISYMIYREFKGTTKPRLVLEEDIGDRLKVLLPSDMYGTSDMNVKYHIGIVMDPVTRRWSWIVDYDLNSATMKTVMFTTITARDIEALDTTGSI